jgi:hypothetical protein
MLLVEADGPAVEFCDHILPLFGFKSLIINLRLSHPAKHLPHWRMLRKNTY